MVIMVVNDRPDSYMWHPIYKDLKKILGFERTIQFFQTYRGSQIHFPMRLVDPKFLGEILGQEYNGKNLRDIAHYYGYSERHLRRIWNSEQKKKSSDQTTINEQGLPYVIDLKEKGEENEK